MAPDGDGLAYVLPPGNPRRLNRKASSAELNAADARNSDGSARIRRPAVPGPAGARPASARDRGERRPRRPARQRLTLRRGGGQHPAGPLHLDHRHDDARPRGASGHSIFAHYPESEPCRLSGTGPPQRFNAHTVTDFDTLLCRYAEIRRDGVSISHGEYDEAVTAVAAPVFHAGSLADRHRPGPPRVPRGCASPPRTAPTRSAARGTGPSTCGASPPRSPARP
ncbi:IclR family transcriptional regulator domain-containing protein [Streptomyces sp. MMS24-I29]|uniref:IclR family transcriptional regulator domain-containing protein n=1 Tax=Streptomyces sp. MMS24-I29 TaxID=3351480 RepID=UPI003C7B9D5D